MRKNMYESAVIINAALDDAQIEAIITKIQDTIQLNGGTISVLDKWGRKRLAYMINKSKIGFYVIFRFEAPSEAISKLERVYRLEESIIRFLTIKLDKFAVEYFNDQEIAATTKVEEVVETPAVAVVETKSTES
ncbi:MAG: 30S ribosomal protein S6 [Ignavibacteria bacterium]|jgi:small subunit ribosomal protein S6|nr:30S ribosomal protein S6 [Ignavibacteria bacterium]MDP3830624.1 30S ribosomal protein S6 [Ignavibacteriaceae bacterium]